MLDKKYDHLKVEEGKYQFWLDHHYFESGDQSKEPFCIVIPPPNVTGKLHLGHAWDTTLQDIIIRYKRMDGYDALWIPGMDHAGIATQAKVDAKLKSMGIVPREMERDAWLEHAWSWKQEYSQNIRMQWGKMGLSLDYTKERFTMDEGLSNAVKKVFVDLYNKGYIYRGERIINWDPEAKTALSNIEVIYKETEGAFYHIKYYLEDSDDYLEVATTRPETLFGDTAVAVNPKDKRYKDFIGKHVILPIVGKKIPIVGDEHADMEFGTGVVKITPAHDPNDFEVGNRHHLERIKVIHEDGTMNENAFSYEGMDRFAAREKLVHDLEEQGLLLKVEKIVHNVGYSERTDVMVEPYLSKQWFVKMEDLANNALKNQKSKDKVQFLPERFEKIYTNWMENAQDWCISRQLWWGHRIPAWYREDEVYVGITPPQGEGWTQDPDVLDTWFSSALWPFSTLGFPEETEALKRYFPTDVLVTGYDIIFFWVSRMMFQSLEFMHQKPFHDVLIHGLVRDSLGRKMSKSLGNGVDPMEVIEMYGADSLRYFLTTSSAPGMDLRYDEEKVKATWNFVNKIWNASRFVLMNLERFEQKDQTFENLSISDQWILNKMEKTIQKVRKHMDTYEFHVVGAELYNFIWNDYCDWYIELSKGTISSNTTKTVLLKVLTNILKMLHPFMPYVTEEIYQMLPVKDADSIVVSAYPNYEKEFLFDTNMDQILEIIKKVRTIKTEQHLKEYCLRNELNDKAFFQEHKDIFYRFLKLSDDKVIEDSQGMNEIEVVFAFGKIILCTMKETVDKQTLEKERESLLASIKKREALLQNENYVKKAPKQVVDLDRKKLTDEKAKLAVLEAALKTN